MRTSVAAGVSLSNEDGSIIFEPNGRVSAGGGIFVDPSGPDRAAAINEAIAEASATYDAAGQQQIVRLSAGLYALEDTVEMQRGVRLVGAGAGATVFAPTYNPPASEADDRANAVIRCFGVVDTSYLDTTLLTVKVPTGSTSLLLADEGTLAALQWILIEGHNDNANEQANISSGASITLREIVQVDASYVGGNSVPLAMATLQHHTATNGGVGVPCSVRGVVPIEDITIEGIDLRCDGLNFASGISIDYGQNVQIRDVTGAGFSRGLIDVRASRRGALDRIHSRGEVNSIVYYDSVLDFVIGTVSSDPNGKRFHPLGGTKSLGGLYMTGRSTNIAVAVAHLHRLVRGLYLVGGVDLAFDLVQISDTDLTEAFARDPGNAQGSAIQQGNTIVSDNETGAGHSFGPVNVTNARQNLADESQCAVWIHDCWYQAWGTITVENDGRSPNLSPYANGLWLQDGDGVIASILTRGVNYALRTRGGNCNFEIGSSVIAGSVGGGGNGAIGLMLDTISGIGTSARIQKLAIANQAIPFFAGPSWEASPTKDWNFKIPEVDADNGYIYTNAVAAINKSGVTLGTGDVVQLDTAATQGQRWVKSHVTENALGYVVVFGAANNLTCLVAPLPAATATVLCDSGLVTLGDLITASNTPQRARANNTPAAPRNVIGKAMVGKAAGADGPVLIGPA